MSECIYCEMMKQTDSGNTLCYDCLVIENKRLHESITAGGEVSRRGVKRIEQLEAQLQALREVVGVTCCHCGQITYHQPALLEGKE